MTAEAKTSGPAKGRMHAAATVGLALAASLVGPGWSAAAGGSGGSGWPTWTDVAAAAGVEFRLAGEVHAEGDDDWPAFPEIMGGGACWGDFDGDGYQDLYLVNQQFNPENPFAADWAASEDPTARLFLNEGDGTFADGTDAGGVAARIFGYGCSAADYDGDADLDLAVTGFGGALLFRNDGDARFTNVTGPSGLDLWGTCGAFACMSMSSAWADMDFDGDLDLYVANYVDTDLEDRRRGPLFHDGQRNWLFRNRGDGTFEERAGAAGVDGLPADVDGSKTLGVAWFDCDADGDMDLYALNDEAPNDFYVNQGDGSFIERDEAGLSDPRASMGVAVGDYDEDGAVDLFFSHYQDEDNGFYRGRGDCTFEDRSGEDDLAHSFDRVGWGTAFLDLDRDADLDLFVVEGHTEPIRDDYAEPIEVFRQDPEPAPEGPGDVRWVDASAESGAGAAAARVHRGAAWADFDWDGDLDLAAVNNGNESAQLLAGAGVTRHWLAVELRDFPPNVLGVGARVEVEAGGRVQGRWVQTGTSYLSQNQLAVDFGLGAAAVADRVVVHWPGGETTTLAGVPADRVIRVAHATGTYVDDTLSPVTRLVVEGAAAGDRWWSRPVGVALQAEDRSVAVPTGVDRTEFALGGDAWAAYTAPFTVGEGVHEVSMRSTDHAGNTEPRRTATVRVDLTPPTPVDLEVLGRPGLDGWWASPEVHLRFAADDAMSGLAEVRYRIGGGAWQVFDADVVVAEDGVHEVEAVAVDRAGNTGPPRSFEVKVDAGPPVAALASPRRGSVYLGADRVADTPGDAALLLAPTPLDFRLEAAAADATSGVALVEFRVDGELLGQDADAPYETPWRLRAESSGPHRVTAVARDRAGNEAAATVHALLVDPLGDVALRPLVARPR